MYTEIKMPFIKRKEFRVSSPNMKVCGPKWKLKRVNVCKKVLRIKMKLEL